MRRCRRSCGENEGTPPAVHALVTAVRNLSPPNPWNTFRSGVRSSRGTSAETTANNTGGTCDHEFTDDELEQLAAGVLTALDAPTTSDWVSVSHGGGEDGAFLPAPQQR